MHSFGSDSTCPEDLSVIDAAAQLHSGALPAVDLLEAGLVRAPRAIAWRPKPMDVLNPLIIGPGSTGTRCWNQRPFSRLSAAAAIMTGQPVAQEDPMTLSFALWDVASPVATWPVGLGGPPVGDSVMVSWGRDNSALDVGPALQVCALPPLGIPEIHMEETWKV